MVESDTEGTMDFFTEDYFRQAAGRIRLFEQREFSAQARTGTVETAKFDVFLSYNIADIEVVKAIFYVLSNKGLKVYLDCIVDPDMRRSETDKQTAERIHRRLMNSKSLLYAQSPAAGTSNWMPWELGVVDGHTGKCFIMPVTNNATHVTPRREYLALYPYVKPDANNRMVIVRETDTTTFTTDFVNYVKG